MSKAGQLLNVRRTELKLNSDRKIFVAALALFASWVAALLIMAMVSGTRPAAAKRENATDLTRPTTESDLQNN